MSRILSKLPLVISILTGIYLLCPIIIIIIISFSSSKYLEFPPPSYSLTWYSQVLSNESWLKSFLTSFEVAIATSMISTFLGICASVGLMGIAFPGKKYLITFFLSPLFIPVIIIAVSSYFFYSGLGLIETKLGLIISHSVLSFSLTFLIIFSSLASLGNQYEIAARTLGEKPIYAFFRITLPLIKPGLIAAFLLSFITSFDEPVIAIFIAGTRTITLPKKMWDGIQYEIDPSITVVSVILIVITLVVIFISQSFLNRIKINSKR